MSITLNGTTGIIADSPATVKANAFLDAAGGNTATVNGVLVALASQAQAQAGTDNATLMTPLRAAQSIAALGGLGGVKVQMFTATGTYTPTSGYKYALAITTDAGGRSTNAVSTGTSGAAGATTFAIYDISAGTARTVTVGTGSTTNAALSTTISGTTATTAITLAGGGSMTTSGTAIPVAWGGGSFWGTFGAYGCGSSASASGGATTYFAGANGVAIILEFK